MMPGVGGRVPEPERVAEILAEHLPRGSLSIAVFGPGRGEAIVVRLPDGSVGVVDGCTEPRGGHARGHGDPVRELLNRIEADPATARPFGLRFVCLTHPHDDHYAGVGRLLDAYRGRIEHLWAVDDVSAHMAAKLIEWSDVTRGGKVPLPDDKVKIGLARVIARLHAAHAQHAAQLTQLIVGRTVFRANDMLPPISITACGPADRDVHAARRELDAALLALVRGEPAPTSFDLNLASGALVLRWGASAILLAGDLLVGDDPLSGWRRGRAHVGGAVQVVNVPHHASVEAHHAETWADMQPALAIVTPFKNAMTDSRRTKYPPRPEQIAALAASSVVTITSPPKWGDDPTFPCPLRKRASSLTPGRDKVLSFATAEPRRNAVAVSMDAAGTITRLILAGAADIYEPPPAGAAARPPL
jgi:glyoxylase-like metal-dependent hydrolase (beta-lactamase superfamily II)